MTSAPLGDVEVGAHEETCAALHARAAGAAERNSREQTQRSSPCWRAAIRWAPASERSTTNAQSATGAGRLALRRCSFSHAPSVVAATSAVSHATRSSMASFSAQRRIAVDPTIVPPIVTANAFGAAAARGRPPPPPRSAASGWCPRVRPFLQETSPVSETCVVEIRWMLLRM